VAAGSNPGRDWSSLAARLLNGLPESSPSLEALLRARGQREPVGVVSGRQRDDRSNLIPPQTQTLTGLAAARDALHSSYRAGVSGLLHRR